MGRTRLIFSGALLAAAAGAWFLPLGDWLLRFAAAIRGAGTGGVLLFFLVYIISAVALVPGSILTLAAGFAYGPVGGLLVASPASVAGASAAFLLGRSLLRPWAQAKVAESARLRALDRALTRQSFRLVLLVRLSPLVPFNIINYAFSATRVPFPTYVAASFIGMIPVTWLYVYLGSLAATAADLRTARAQGGAWRLALVIVGLAASGLAVWLVTRAAKRALEEDLREGPSRP